MDWTQVALAGASICSAVQLAALAKVGFRSRWVENFSGIHSPEPNRWPSLTLIVPACNEAETLGPALRSLLKLDYPELKIVVVNDRSTDGTGAVLDAVAGTDERIVAIHNDHLPAGWLGKVHALKLGVEASESEWILFSDADVHMAPDVVRRTVAYALDEQLDHLPVCPDLAGPSLWVNVCVAAFHVQLLMLVSPRRILDPERPDAVGVGAFNLVRRATLDRSEGLAWLRLEVADDLALGALLKRAGGKAKLVYATESLRVAWYGSVAGLFRGLEKNVFGAIGHYSFGLAVARSALSGVVLLLPWSAPLIESSPSGWLVPLVPLIGTWALGVFMARRIGWPVHRFLLMPIGLVILGFAMLNGIWKSWRRGGIDWRGTTYTLAELRAGQRVKL
jgi:glycosyltransferase involved in cell wall biosynthesis